MLRAWVVMLAGCGRLGFGDPAPDAIAGDDASIDAVTDAVVTDLAPVPPMLRLGNRPDVDMMDVVTDTLLDSSQPTNNFGSHPDLHLSDEPILIRIDLAGVPTHARVTTARLTLTVETSALPAAAQILAYRVLEAWTEGSADATAGIANHTTRSTGVAWTTAGVGAPGSRDGVSIAGAAGPVGVASSFVLTLPPVLVEQWIQQPATNHGVVLLYTAGYSELASSEALDMSHRPVLELALY